MTPETDADSTLVRVAFQGAPGAFSHEVIVSLWGDAAEVVPSPRFDDAVAALTSGDATHLVIPVSNTTIGPIHPALDALSSAPSLHEVQRVTYDVRHMLMSVPGATLAGVRRVLCHPAALAQCRRFLAERPDLTVEEAFDTAGAAAFVAHSGDPAIAAIAPAGAARLHGLEIIAADLQDAANNATVFAVFTR